MRSPPLLVIYGVTEPAVIGSSVDPACALEDAVNVFYILVGQSHLESYLYTS